MSDPLATHMEEVAKYCPEIAKQEDVCTSVRDVDGVRMIMTGPRSSMPPTPARVRVSHPPTQSSFYSADKNTTPCTFWFDSVREGTVFITETGFSNRLFNFFVKIPLSILVIAVVLLGEWVCSPFTDETLYVFAVGKMAGAALTPIEKED